ncbi:MAG: ATP-dependent helicase [Polyangiaceae bacterium]|jgi:superfamily I DNA/RNA helicase
MARSGAKNRLNREQRAAVEHAEGPLLVLAGAGSGKTRVITHRIAHLVERGVPAEAIVALTFTNKAAAEMRERTMALLGPERSQKPAWKHPRGPRRALTICTFHAFGLDVLGREREAVGGRFTIFDQGDQMALVKQLLRAAGAERAYDAQAVLARISNAKNAFLAPDELPSKDPYDEIAKALYPRYRDALRRYRAFDFDDLVCEVATLWRERGDVRARWQDRFLHVLVDEYQDTNKAQLEMLRLLCGRRRNVCAVGDDDQAIYGWRGADVRNILDFERHFEGARVIKLQQNYRSRAPVLAVANAVIAKRTDARWRKVLFTERAGGDAVRSIVATTPEAEAAWVGREVRRLLRDDGQRPREVAVLYRSNGQSRLLEEALREQGIAHRVVGGTQFFERKEVKDVLAYVKLALNPSDEISLRRVVNYPARGIGETTLDRLVSHASGREWSLWQTIERVDALDDIPTAARDGCHSLAQVVSEARRSLGAKRPPSEIVRNVCERIALKAELTTSAPSPDAAARRWANVEGVLATLARRETREGGAGADGLAAFVHTLTMDIEADTEDPGDAVTLSTLHGSKGLEFEVVFLVGCEEGYLPHARTLDARASDASAGPEGGVADIEEERRLFYVGITRARERLVLSRARSRVLRGRAVPRTVSRFLLDVPAELVEEQQVTDEAPTTMQEATANAAAILAMLAGAKP